MTSTYRTEALKKIEETSALYGELTATYQLAREFSLATRSGLTPSFKLVVTSVEWNETKISEFAVFRVPSQISIETYMIDLYYKDAQRIREKLGLPTESLKDFRDIIGS